MWIKIYPKQEKPLRKKVTSFTLVWIKITPAR